MTNVKFQTKQRPKLADEIGKFLHAIPRYLRVPTLAYQIGDCTLEKDSTLRIPDSVDSETIAALLEHLKEKGFDGETERQEDRLAVSLPRGTLDEAALANLKKIIANRAELFKKAFGAESVEITVTADEIKFPWFSLAEPQEAQAYAEFVSRLCEMAKNSKRVSGKAAETDNDKFTFRCFLLRLGFIGSEHKSSRKTLLKNLSGNSAFRYGRP